MNKPPVLSWEEPVMPEPRVIQCLGGYWGPYLALIWDLKEGEIWGQLL